MKYEEMLRIMDEYLNSDDLKNQDWIEIIQTSKQLIQKELNAQNDIK
ncbi:MAG: hypothetical protein SPJ27_00175 [Candidatus Onthovivens sp.]|nr:hypothetical protein [Candidatus Onthovivens sp.]